MQAEGISFSLEDKLAIVAALDDLGFDYIEGGFAASNQKEMQFFAALAEKPLKNSTIVAFGSTRRANTKAEDDTSLNAILQCKTSAATIVGKTWDLHVTEVLNCSLDDNLKICDDSIRFLRRALL